MVELTWVSLGAAALVSLIAYVLWKQTYWRRRGVVQTQPRFLIGDMWEAMWKKSAGQVLEAICKKYEKEPFVGAYKVLTPVLVVKDPEIIAEVLVKNFTSFGNNEVTFSAKDDGVFSENPFGADIERWKELRTKMMQSFTTARIRTVFEDFLTSSRCLADFVAAAGPDATLDGTLLCKRFTAHASARVLFGIESHSLEAGSEPGAFYDSGNRVFNGGWLQSLRFFAFFFFPPLLRIIGSELVVSDTVDFFRKLIQDSVEYRQKEGLARDDFVQHAAKVLIVDGKVDKVALKKLTHQAINSFIETFETSALTLASALLLLATHPEEQERVRAELREHLQPGQPLDYETVNTLPFLDQVFKETMRLFPPADTIRRRCTRAARLESASGRSVLVEPGTPVYVPVEAVHHDPALYSHPVEFWPDHFSPEEVAGRPKATYLGFGDGPRQCPGSRFASVKVKTALATLVQRFEMVPAERQVLPLRRDPTTVMINYQGGNWLKFRPVS
ncbi:putative cytochrome P450 6a18 [Frankliniella fusca]|uniref:Cytochrome P450 6a18 n=1 Tax=Frankliniella fusca TaxID=407009 RepID=A0AAE1H9Q0_9NEOP|nr:putative cytochrome P450 6a18 [Frankliniella fusca]